MMLWLDDLQKAVNAADAPQNNPLLPSVLERP